MTVSAIFVLVFLLLAAACFLGDALGVAVARPRLLSLGLFLATLAALTLIWP